MSDYPQQLLQQELDDDDNFSVSDYISILLDEWRLFIAPFIIVVLGTLGYLLIVIP